MIPVTNNLSEIVIFAEWNLKTSSDNIIIVGDVRNGMLFAEEKDSFFLQEKRIKADRNIHPRILLGKVLRFAEEKGCVPKKSLLLPFEGGMYLTQEGKITKSKFI